MTNRKAITGQNDIFSVHPEVKKIWDFDKNTIDPYKTHYGTGKKAFFKCVYGHSYYRSIRIAHKCECKECKAIRKSIAFKAYIMDFIDLKDNPELDIYHTYAYEAKMINWRCKKCGYRWSSLLYSRKTNKCPCCDLGVVIVEGINDVLTVVPTLAKDYKQELNPGIDIHNFGVADKTIPITWKCHVCNYIWSSTIFSRTRGHNGENKINKCPCCGHAKRATTFDVQYPFLVEIYSPNNKKPLPSITGKDYGKKFKWICKEHGEYEASLASILRSFIVYKTKGCPYCSNKKTSYKESFGYKHPDLVKELSPIENCLLFNPYEISENSAQYGWFQCQECGYQHYLPVCERVLLKKKGKTFCPKEKGKNFSKEHFL